MNISSTTRVPSSTLLYRELATVLARHGGRLAVESTGLDFLSSSLAEVDKGEELAQDLEDLGPSFVKLGQVLSTRTDLFAPATVKALERLQDNVQQVPYEEIRAVLEQSLGSPVDLLFKSFATEPIASASLGQVHKAVLHSGEEVVVKIQRPLIAERVTRELKVLGEFSESLEKHSKRIRRLRVGEIIKELTSSLSRELDYRLEKENLKRFRHLLKDSDLVFVPKPYERYCSEKVLTMDYVEGDKLPSEPLVGHSSGAAIADDLFRLYLEHVLLEGEFHADPHPGNLLLTAEGRICLLDLGMIGQIPGSLQIVLARLLLAISNKDGEQVAETALDISGRAEGSDDDGFRRGIASLVAEYHSRPLAQMQAGELIMDIVQAANENGILIPYELTMLAKTLMNLDEIGRRLDPEFNPTEALERHVGVILMRRLKADFNVRALVDSYMEIRTLAKDGPRLANNILRDLERGSFAIRVDAIDERELLVSFQKIANRIGMSLVIGSLVMGASLLMGTDVDGPKLWGYPAFAVVAFLLAFGGGLGTVWSVFSQDQAARKNTAQN